MLKRMSGHRKADRENQNRKDVIPGKAGAPFLGAPNEVELCGVYTESPNSKILLQLHSSQF